MKPQIAGAALFALTAVGLAAEPSTAPAPADASPLRIDKPKGWIRQTIGSRDDAVSLHFFAREPGGPVSVNLMFRLDPPGRPADDGRLRDLVTEAARAYVDDSVEGRIELRPLDAGDGYVVTLTDATPPTDRKQFACATAVGRRVGKGLLLSTVLHPKDSRHLPLALAMVRNATVDSSAAAPPATAPATQPLVLRLLAPDGKWAAVLDLPAAPVAPPRQHGNGASAGVVAELPDGSQCTVSIDPAQTPGDATAVRTFLFEKRIKPVASIRQITLSGDGEQAMLAFSAGGPNRQVLATQVRDGQWVTFQMSNVFATDADQRLMMRVMKSARIEPTTRSATTRPDGILSTTRPDEVR